MKRRSIMTCPVSSTPKWNPFFTSLRPCVNGKHLCVFRLKTLFLNFSCVVWTGLGVFWFYSNFLCRKQCPCIVCFLLQEYEFDLTCKTGIGREFKLHCRAVGVLPPLELSHSVIKMKATAVSDTCSAHIEVINSHTSANEFTHPVPRIGSGPIVAVGATSFEFVVPAGAPLTVSPAVGCVSPGEVSFWSACKLLVFVCQLVCPFFLSSGSFVFVFVFM